MTSLLLIAAVFTVLFILLTASVLVAYSPAYVMTFAKKEKDSSDSGNSGSDNKDSSSSDNPAVIETPKVVQPDIPGPNPTTTPDQQTQTQQQPNQSGANDIQNLADNIQNIANDDSGSSSSSSSSSHSKKLHCEDLDLSKSEEKQCSKDKDSSNINLDQSPSVDKFSLRENGTMFMIRWANDSYTGSVIVPKLASESSIGTNVHKGIVPTT